MLEFFNHQVDKITLLVAMAILVYVFSWMIHYNIADRWIEGVWGATLLVLGALLREVSGSISSIVKTINGNKGNGVVEKN